ncbi:GNAT family N-acetyltransferase [Streptomyces ureilyticus]|uniref:GNAT family N-acetyltransferase n=1 Tax=Streptomyces ureilyticus TaxID=1775131 RepID=A0ABX0E4L8_9ACTN|nr:GNAT family N-acetyltransferase [Streptomyces ureilyticus]NGO47513.1 GNAT family N-acetyltransferase [Streptomyces ureilyticus]
MSHISDLNSVDDIPVGEWEELTHESDIDASRGFLQFREFLEPGESVLLTSRSAGRLQGALRGVLAVPESGLTSDPWKFVGSQAVLRLDDSEEGKAAPLRRAQRALACEAAGAKEETDGEAPLWQVLSRGVGPCLVVREFDRSELQLHPEADAAEAESLAAQLVRAAQTWVVEKGAGAVAFPFVSPRDGRLREVLTQAGFRGGAMTGASWMDTGRFGSYEEFLTALPSRRRRRYLLEERRLQEAPGLATGVADLARNAERVAALEAQTLIKHGGKADVEAIRRARIELAGRLPDAVRVPTVEQDGRILACALHLQGRKSVVFMSYGCDYGVEDRSAAYPWAAFYYPIRTAITSGAATVRLGLEGFEAKTRRGAVTEARELWVWIPDAVRLGRLGELLDLVGDRNTAYLKRFAG